MFSDPARWWMWPLVFGVFVLAAFYALRVVRGPWWLRQVAFLAVVIVASVPLGRLEDHYRARDAHRAADVAPASGAVVRRTLTGAAVLDTQLASATTCGRELPRLLVDALTDAARRDVGVLLLCRGPRAPQLRFGIGAAGTPSGCATPRPIARFATARVRVTRCRPR
ncbi:MAG: hypothetical protein JWM31_1192 [Solirubrobacterales bacterium]|nr:hypothetical protein [Solirubrobacterales bacterium]